MAVPLATTKVGLIGLAAAAAAAMLVGVVGIAAAEDVALHPIPPS